MTAAAPAGLVDRMGRTWRDPRAAAREEIAHADEGRLLVYAFLTGLFGVIGAVGAQAMRTDPAVAADFQGWMTATVATGLFVRPLSLYGAAGLIGLGCRAFGGRGGWRATRAACFWTALTVAPAAALLATLGAALSGLGGAPDWVAGAGAAAGGVLWAVLLAPALAQAHGFASSRRVLAALAAIGLALVALALAAPG